MDYDVIVVGGGPTGLWLACELALAHVRVAVLEKLAEPTGLSKALGLQSRSMEMLEYRGILDRFTAGNSAPPFLNFAMFPLDLRKIDFPYPYGVIIPQAHVEALLEEHAKELGVEIRRGHEFVDLRQDERGVLVEVSAPHGKYALTALHLAGCDGAHSAVRKQLDVEFPGLPPTIMGRMGDVRLDADSLELLKRGVPELGGREFGGREFGGREFGVARTKTGNFAIVPLRSQIYRLAAIEWDQSAIDREMPMGLEELRAAIRRVIGIDLSMHDPTWLSRATDSSRLVDRYRVGRVFLAGDAAHVHWAYGGKGLQTGIQDAGNLAWKLAGQIHGWAPFALLDTYHTERHPIGQRLMTFTRAQQALARPGEHVTALRELFNRFLAEEGVFRALAEEITDVDICYEMTADDGEPHPLLGRWAPNLNLQHDDCKLRVAELMSACKGVLLDLVGRTALSSIASKWADRVETITARCDDRPANLEAMLIRPDCYVAWAISPAHADKESGRPLQAALVRWFGAPA